MEVDWDQRLNCERSRDASLHTHTHTGVCILDSSYLPQKLIKCTLFFFCCFSLFKINYSFFAIILLSKARPPFLLLPTCTFSLSLLLIHSFIYSFSFKYLRLFLSSPLYIELAYNMGSPPINTFFNFLIYLFLSI